ncbi:acyclic terpene utilization AtuA family protein [Rhizobium binxianense]
MYRIGSGAGFSGDRIDAAQPVVAAIAAAGEGGAIIFETIGERTLALGQIAKRRNPDAGYEPLLAQFLPPILKTCVENRIVIVGNFGCANPRAAARAIISMAEAEGLPDVRVAVVEGDDLIGQVDIHTRGQNKNCSPRHAKVERTVNVPVCGACSL